MPATGRIAPKKATFFKRRRIAHAAHSIYSIDIIALHAPSQRARRALLLLIGCPILRFRSIILTDKGGPAQEFSATAFSTGRILFACEGCSARVM
jgi:hypothetical protein